MSAKPEQSRERAAHAVRARMPAVHLVVPSQIHTIVEVRDLFAVAVEH